MINPTNSKKQRTSLTLLLWVMFITACQPMADKPLSSADISKINEKLQGRLLAPVSFSSAITDSEHSIWVYLPHNYQQTQKPLPVIYMTDAQWSFEFYAETLDWKKMQFVLVGIEQPSLISRFIDFTWLGADDYLHFLKREVTPYIETHYNVSQQRSYMGISLGALFGATLLSDEAPESPFFSHYFLFDGSFNLLTSSQIAKEGKRFSQSQELAVKLILTSANPGNHQAVAEFKKRYQQREYKNLDIHFKAYDIHHHSIAAPSFADFIDTLQ